MCLRKLYKDKGSKNEGIGYKIMTREKNESFLRSPFRVYHYDIGKWIHDSLNMHLAADDDKNYETGFHIFTSKWGAKIWCHHISGRVHKLKYKNVVARGEQWGHEILVVKDIFMMDECPISKFDRRLIKVDYSVRNAIHNAKKKIKGESYF